MSALLSTKAVAEALGVSEKWLKTSPEAPPYIVLGPRKHAYAASAVEAWKVAKTVNPAERRAA